MAVQTWVYILLMIDLLTAVVQSVSLDECPISCECDYTKKEVWCSKGYWNTWPPLPNGTRNLLIETANFGKLTKPPSCKDYNMITTLELRFTNISSIAIDAFKCMPMIGSLEIISNPIQNISSEVFQYLPNLQNVAFHGTQLGSDIIPELCTRKKLKSINLFGHGIHFDAKTMECLRLLWDLSEIDFAFNIIKMPVAQTIQPLKEVSNYISLAYCKISKLTDYTFKGFKVKILDLSFNDISFVPRHTFTQMAHLNSLDISHNELWEISGWFMELKVQTISISSNHLTLVPPIKNGMSKLVFTGNPLRRLQNGCFSNLDTLLEIDLRGCSISVIERGAFYNLSCLTKLYLNDNNIVEQNLINLLLGVTHSPLQTLVLSGNPLKALNRTFDVFKSNKLEVLSLLNCDISSIQPGSFINFHNLQFLGLTNNMLESLNPGTFEGLTQLVTLDLTRNRLTQLNPYVFRGLTKLKTLRLTTNRINTVMPNAFSGLSNLRDLILHGNRIEDFDGKKAGLQNSTLTNLTLRGNGLRAVSLRNISTLVEVVLSDNDLYEFDLFMDNLPMLKYLDLFKSTLKWHLRNLTNLLYLDLSKSTNFFSDLASILGEMQKLQTLKLSGTLYYWPFPDLWNTLHMLEILHVDKCKIYSLQPEMFSSLYNLQILDASSNKIPYIEPAAFKNLSNLKELSLDDNLITFMNWESFIHLPRLKLLSIAGNPLLCTCENIWIFQAITVTGMVYVNEHHALVCNRPLDVQKIQMKDLGLNLADCEKSWIDILKPTAIGLACVLVLILMYFVWHYRWHIRYTLFLARAGRGRYIEANDDHNYKYDAFVAYSSKDLPWVQRQLMPNIDAAYADEGGFKLCVHHRDWLAGIDIVENIVKSIAESRRTILVLTKDFAASEWCQFELAMAHMKLGAEGYGKDRLMVILLNDIPTKLLTPRLIYILRLKTYLSWPEDPTQQALFWKTLKKSLKKGLLYDTNV